MSELGEGISAAYINPRAPCEIRFMEKEIDSISITPQWGVQRVHIGSPKFNVCKRIEKDPSGVNDGGKESSLHVNEPRAVFYQRFQSRTRRRRLASLTAIEKGGVVVRVLSGHLSKSIERT